MPRHKIINAILSSLVVMSTLSAQPIKAAEEFYTYSCGSDYEVSVVNNDGGFNVIGCYGSYISAQESLKKSGDDAVIRHNKSYSPTKIIAMNHGIAISYPQRVGSAILTLSSNKDGSGKTTYVAPHRELTLASVETYNGSGDGRVHVYLNGFDGYVDLKQVDLVPMKYIEDGISIYLGGNDKTKADEQPFSTTLKSSYFTSEKNGNYTDLVFYWYSGYNGEEYKHNIGVAPDWMETGHKYFSWDGVNFYTDNKYLNYAGEYFNYYQFLPTRSKSNIASEVYNKFLSNHGYTKKPAGPMLNLLIRNESQLWNEGGTFVQAQDKYGINALLVFSMATLESGYGRSNYAVNRNNLFGWNAYDSDPDQASYFPTIKQAIYEHMGINLRGYTDITDARFFGSQIGNKGSGFNVKYASDPYWGMKIAAIAYEIDKTSNNYNGSLTDYNCYELAVVNTYDAKVYKDKTMTNVLYTTGYGSNYQKNFIVVVLEQNETWTKIQLTNGLYENGTLVTHRDNGQSTGGNIVGLVEYDFDKSVGYIKTSDLRMLNQNKNPDTTVGMVPNGDFISNSEDVKIVNGKLIIEGYGYQSGVYLQGIDQAKYTLLVVNSENETFEYRLSNRRVDIENYEYSGYYGEVDLAEIGDGEHKLYIQAEYEYGVNEKIKETKNIALNISEDVEITIENYSYTLSKNKEFLTLRIKKIEKELNYITNLIEISLDDELKLNLKGIAFIQGVDNKDENTLHELVAVSLDTDEVAKVYTLKNSTGNFSLNDAYSHGYDYSYGWFDDRVDVSNLPNGEYYFYLQTTVNGHTFKTRLYGTSSIKGSSEIGSNGVYYQLSMLYGFSYRVELRISNYSLNTIVKKPLPRIREAEQTLLSFRYDDNTEQIVISGSAFTWDTSYRKEDNPTYTLDVVNEITGEIFSYQVTGDTKVNNEEAPWNNTTKVNSEHNYDNTWYYFEVPLADLSNGTYSLRLSVETNDYVEYIVLRDVTDTNYPSIEGETLTLKGYINRANKRKIMFKLNKNSL